MTPTTTWASALGTARLVVAMLSLVAATALPSGPAIGEDVARGRDLAIRHCAFCHVVGDHNRFGGIGSTPSFQLLAGLDDGDERFQTFFERLPHPSFVYLPGQQPPTGLPLSVPDVNITYEDVLDIAAFARTLEGQSPTR